MTEFGKIYDSFFSKITDDMFMEITMEETEVMLQELLANALPWFEFPRFSTKMDIEEQCFEADLTREEINIISTYMVVEWIGVQLANVDLTRMMYTGADFKMTSQANHMRQLKVMSTEYTQKGFHLQRLYSRRKKNDDGVYESTFSSIMEKGNRHYGHKV